MRNSIKMIYLIFIILMLCVPVTASKTEKENTIHKGDTYTVTLNENPSTRYTWYVISVLHQLDQKIIYPHYDLKHLTEKYFEIGMKLNDFSIQLVKYCL